MAKYKRQKVKRYRRSFYSRGTRIKKGIGIVVLVLAVLGAAWLAAPHVLDWATHTWYTVSRTGIWKPRAHPARRHPPRQRLRQPRRRLLPRRHRSRKRTSLTVRQSFPAGGQSWTRRPSRTMAPPHHGTAAEGAGRGIRCADLKDAAGNIYYASQAAAAAGGIVAEPLDAGHIAAILREEKLIPVAQLAAFKDPISPRTDLHGHPLQRQRLWLDARKNGNPWLNPYSTAQWSMWATWWKRCSSWALSRWC